MTEPTTKAGRALLAYFPEIASTASPVDVARGILAIEAEAATPYRAALAALVAAVELWIGGEEKHSGMADALAAARSLIEEGS